MNLAPLKIVTANESLYPSVATTATGVGTALPGYSGADSLIFELDVTVVTGTNPTLDVLVQDSADGVNFFTLATFTQVTAAAHAVQRINKTTTPNLDKLRVSFTIGGTSTPTFTFSVTAYAVSKIASDRQP